MIALKKIITLSLLLAALFQFFVFPVSATTTENINTSDVLSDLEKMVINGEKFDTKKYPANPKADYIEVLNFLEYGYDYGGDQSEYGIYIYIYNPSCRPFVDSSVNKVQIGTEAGAVKNAYYKYPLKEISHSADYRFIKYKISDLKPATSASYIYQTVFSNERVYNVSGIELLSQGSYNAHDYEVSGTYKFSGYMKWHRKDPTAESSLRCDEKSLLTIKLDLNWTVYRTQTSSYGENHQNEIMTVYFAFPNDLFEQFKYLYSIQGEYSEYKIESIVTESSTAYNQWKNYTGTTLKDMLGSVEKVGTGRFDGKSYWVCPDYYSFSHLVDSWTVGSSEYNYSIGFNEYCYFGTTGQSATIYDYTYLLESVPYFYYVSEIKGPGEIDISPYEVIDKVNTEGLYYLDGGVIEEGHRQGLVSYDIKLDDTYELKSYRSNHSWWDYMLAGNWGHEYMSLPADDITFQPIVHFDPQDLNIGNDRLSDEFFIYSEDVDDFKDYVSKQTLNGNAVHLFRFTGNDYYAEPLDLYNPDGTKVEGVDSYYARQTYIDDFDICSLTFMTYDNRLVVVPVVADPIDMSGGTGLTSEPVDWFMQLVMLILGAAICGFLLWGLYKLIILVLDAFGIGDKSRRKSSGSSKKRRRKRVN